METASKLCPLICNWNELPAKLWAALMTIGGMINPSSSNSRSLTPLIGACLRMRYRLVARLELDGCSQGFGYFGGDIVLNHQDVVEGAVVGFGPDDVAVVCAN